MCYSVAHGNQPSTENCSTDLKSVRMGVRHIENKGIGYDTGYTTLEAFFAFPSKVCTLTPFIDLRGHILNNGKCAANGGIGLRGASHNIVYGANIYYDYRATDRKHYNQVSFGIEALSRWIDGRINGYFPTGTTISSPYDLQFDKFQGHNMYVTQRFQYALKGGNGEIGFHLSKAHNFKSYIAVGPYYLVGKIGKGIWGGETRFNATCFKFLTLDLSYSYDHVFKNIVQGQVGLKYSFGPRSCKRKNTSKNCSQKKVMNQFMLTPVNKFEIIPVNSSSVTSIGLNPATGIPYYFVFVDNTSASLGTYESPYHTLTQAEMNSSPGDIIYVFPGNGTTQGMDVGISLQKNQKFWGSGTAHPIQTVQGVLTIPIQSATTPQITNIDGDGVSLSTGNDISGITFTEVMGNGIFGLDPENIQITYCTMNGSVLDQVHLEYQSSSGNIDINNLTLTDGLLSGVFVQTQNAPLTCAVSNCIIQRSNHIPINITVGGVSTLSISNNIMMNTVQDSSVPLYISTGSNPLYATIISNTITNNPRGGVTLQFRENASAQITLRENTISNNTSGAAGVLGNAIFVDATDSTYKNCNLLLTKNTISNNEESALYCSNGSFNDFQVTAIDNIITENVSGFVFDNPCNTLSFTATNNVISNGRNHGVTTQARTMTTVDMTLINNEINYNIVPNPFNGASAVAIAHGGADFNFIATGNTMSNNDSSGITMYSNAGGITNISLYMDNNNISNNQNLNGNGAGGVDIQKFFNLAGTFTNNALSNNATAGVNIGSDLSSPYVCWEMRGNTNSTDPGYIFDSGSGTFNLAPCNVMSVNTGSFSNTGVTAVQSCPGAATCPP